MAEVFVIVEDDGSEVRLSRAEFAKREEQEKLEQRAERFVELLNDKRASVNRQERLLADAEKVVTERRERLNRFRAEYAELLDKQNDRVGDGFTVVQAPSGEFSLVKTPADVSELQNA